MCIDPVPVERNPDSMSVRRPDVSTLIDAVEIVAVIEIQRSLCRFDLRKHKSEIIEVGVSYGPLSFNALEKTLNSSLSRSWPKEACIRK